MMVSNDVFDPELSILKCKSCGGPMVWVWNKATTNRVRCTNKECPDYATMTRPEDCTILDPETDEMVI